MIQVSFASLRFWSCFDVELMFSYLITLIYGKLLGNWEHLESMKHSDTWKEKHSFSIHSHVLEDKKMSDT